MTLLVNELHTELFQVVRPDRNSFVQAVRIHVYKHNTPAGSLTVEIRDLNNKKIAASLPVLISDIDGPFYHGLITFNIVANLQSGVEYKVVLVPKTYSFSESAYIGWCNSYDLKSYPPDYTLNNSLYAPRGLEIWTLK